MMNVETYPLGLLQANCYLLWKDQHVLIVDPGGSSKKVLSILEERNAIVDGIVLTHGHFDHIGGLEFFHKHYSCDIYVSEGDMIMLTDPKMNCSDMFEGFTTNLPFKLYEQAMHIGAFMFEAIEAPGHSNGSTLLVFEDFMFSGDVLFKQSIGRCDLPTGSNAKMTQTLRMIATMNPNLIVYPGHGEKTTIQYELQHNSFLQNI